MPVVGLAAARRRARVRRRLRRRLRRRRVRARRLLGDVDARGRGRRRRADLLRARASATTRAGSRTSATATAASLGAAAVGVFGGLVVTDAVRRVHRRHVRRPRRLLRARPRRAARPAGTCCRSCSSASPGSVGQGALNLYATGLDMESLVPRLAAHADDAADLAWSPIALVFLGTFVLDAVDAITAADAGAQRRSPRPWVAVCSSASSRAAARYDPHDLQVFNEGRTGGRYWFTPRLEPRAPSAAWAAGSAFGLLTVNTTLYAGPLADLAGGVDVSLVSALPRSSRAARLRLSRSGPDDRSARPAGPRTARSPTTRACSPSPASPTPRTRPSSRASTSRSSARRWTT